MIKPSSLRRALVAALPSLESDPDKLAVFIDQGKLIATGTRSLSFEYRYTVNALVMDFAGNPDAVFMALVEWARGNQPDLVTAPVEPEHGITFEVDILNHATVDLSVKLALTESVAVTSGTDGKRIITHVDDEQVDPANTMTWVANHE